MSKLPSFIPTPFLPRLASVIHFEVSEICFTVKALKVLFLVKLWFTFHFALFIAKLKVLYISFVRIIGKIITFKEVHSYFRLYDKGFVVIH